MAKTLARKKQKRGGKRARKTQKRMRGGMTPAILLALALAASLGTAQGYLYNTNINGKIHTRGNNDLNDAFKTLADNNIIDYEESFLGNPKVTITKCNKAYEIIENAKASPDFESIPKSVQNAIIKVHETFSCHADGELKNDEEVVTAALKQADLGIFKKVPNADVRIAEMEKAIVALEKAKPSAEEIDKKTKNNEKITIIDLEIAKLQGDINSLREIYKIPIK
jgi:hypothetical protein